MTRAMFQGTTGNAGLIAFTRAMGGRSLADGIRVVGINPGPVDTERIYRLLKVRARDLYGDEARFTELLKSYPLGRPAKVREVVDLMVFLASDRSGYTTGTVITWMAASRRVTRLYEGVPDALRNVR